MWLLLLEAALALALLVFIVGWTMWPKRGDLKRDGAQAPQIAPGDAGEAPRPPGKDA